MLAVDVDGAVPLVVVVPVCAVARVTSVRAHAVVHAEHGGRATDAGRAAARHQVVDPARLAHASTCRQVDVIIAERAHMNTPPSRIQASACRQPHVIIQCCSRSLTIAGIACSMTAVGIVAVVNDVTRFASVWERTLAPTAFIQAEKAQKALLQPVTQQQQNTCSN